MINATRFDVFDAMIDKAREEYWMDDLNMGIQSVYDYASNGMEIELCEIDATIIFWNFVKYLVMKDCCLIDGQDHFYKDFKEPLDIALI